MDRVTKTLGDLGLGAHEAKVYAALLEESPLGAAHLAKKCGLPRSSVYTTLDILQGKGLIGTTHKNEVKQFVVEGHRALLDHLQREREEADKRLSIAERFKSELEPRRGTSNLTKQDGIIQFEGQDGLRRIYLAMLREARKGSTLCILRDEFIWHSEWDFVQENAWTDRVKRLKVDKDLTTRLLVNASPIEKKHHTHYKARTKLETRVLPARFQVSKFALYLVEDAASILSVERGNLVGVKISDRHLARNMAMLFEAMWLIAKPLRR